MQGEPEQIALSGECSKQQQNLWVSSHWEPLLAFQAIWSQGRNWHLFCTVSCNEETY